MSAIRDKSQKKNLHDFIVIAVHESAVHSWLFTLPLKQSDHVASEGALKGGSGEVNIGAVNIVKEVLEGGVDLKRSVDDEKKRNDKYIKNFTAVAATATIYGGISRSFLCSSLE